MVTWLLRSVYYLCYPGIWNKVLLQRTKLQNLLNVFDRLAEKKAAIGYTYQDSTPAPDKKEEEEEENDDDILSDDEVDLDMAIDIEQLTNDQIEGLNACAMTYGMGNTDYFE